MTTPTQVPQLQNLDAIRRSVNAIFAAFLAPLGGLLGVTDGSNAPAGSVGEYQSATFSSVSLTSGTPVNLASLSLTAGDWDVTGFCIFVTSGTAAMQIIVLGLSTTSATLPALGSYFQSSGLNVSGSGGAASANAPVTRENVSSPTTVYLVGQANFSGSPVNASGFIRARRVR